jgi:hypothetical protein
MPPWKPPKPPPWKVADADEGLADESAIIDATSAVAIAFEIDLCIVPPPKSAP